MKERVAAVRSLLPGAARAAVCVVLLTLASVPAPAQLLAAKDGPVVYGHHHLNVTSIDEHKKFWTTLGGRPVKVNRKSVV